MRLLRLVRAWLVDYPATVGPFVLTGTAYQVATVATAGQLAAAGDASQLVTTATATVAA